MRGGVCGPCDRHRDFLADGRLPAGNACGVVRGVIGFHYRKTTAEFHCAESGLNSYNPSGAGGVNQRFKVGRDGLIAGVSSHPHLD